MPSRVRAFGQFVFSLPLVLALAGAVDALSLFTDQPLLGEYVAPSESVARLAPVPP